MGRAGVRHGHSLALSVSRGGTAWKPGPDAETLPVETPPKPRYDGSGPTWQRFHYSQLPWITTPLVVPTLTTYDRKGNITNVRLLENGGGDGWDRRAT